jgi:inorganic pyrophosphatase
MGTRPTYTNIPAELRNEVEHFFQVYKDLEEAKVETFGYGNRADAERVLAEARARAGSGEG